MTLPDPSAIAAAALRLPAGAQVDAYTGADLRGGHLRLRLASGREVAAVVTVPGDGALRVRICGADAGAAEISPTVGAEVDSPMLAFTHERPATLLARDGRIVAEGDGIIASWGNDGSFGVGQLVRSAADGVMGLAGLPAGQLRRDGEPAGWVERFRLEPGAGVFGGGESSQGPQLRGRLRRLRNAETTGSVGYDLTYLNVPFFWSDAGWGVFIHSGGAVHADLGATSSEVMSLATADTDLDLFYLCGTPAQILRRYLALTGAPGALPEWALGVWLSRCTYLSEEQLHSVLTEAELAQCPVDVVHVDGWQDGDVLADLACNWSPDVDRFPPGWVERITSRGPRVSLWLNPYVPAESPVAAELTQAGMFATVDGAPAHTPDIPGRLVLDFTAPRTTDWWRERLVAIRSTEPYAALKADFGEEVPEDAVFADGRRGAQLRNEYALRYQQATHAAFGGEESAMFCRSGTAGAQRYPCHWVGDSASTWDGLVTALRACLSLSLSGFAWVAHDIGGFWAAESGDAHVRSFAAGDASLVGADVDPELFLRWAQWGAFSPVMRFHGTGVREPFGYPEPYGGLAVRATQVRRALRPYLNQVAADVHTTGLPAMRPMALAFPEHPEARDSLQYLLGPDILVAPVLRPGGSIRLWVPPGEWMSLFGDLHLTGSGWTTVTCPLSQFPAFVRIAGEAPVWCQDVRALVPRPTASVRGKE